jgi:pSer/pThr/pTyr-binding forkhead associated (FHA) protein
MFARLTVHFPLQPTRSFLVHGDAESVIGRDPDCDIVLDDERVSRRHARLVFVESAWRLVDLDSTNGTSLQGRPMREAALGNAGWISFGGLLARFEHSTAERERAESRRREERFRTSISLRRELNPSLGLERLLERVLGSVLQLSGTDRGFALLRREDGTMDIAARRNLGDPDLKSDGFSGSVGAIRRVESTARPVAVSDALADPLLQERESVISGRIRGMICLPMVAFDRLIGLIYADSREPGTSFGELDVEILEALAAHAALAIVMARVDRELGELAARLPDVASELARARALVVGLGGLESTGPATSWTGVLAHHQARASEAS